MPELNRLDKIISRDLATLDANDISASGITVTYLLQDFPEVLQAEADRIRRNMITSLVDTPSGNQLRRYIRKIQHRLVTLDARLLKYTSVDKLVSEVGKQDSGPIDLLCQHMHKCLLELLVFIENHFGRYLYWNTWVNKNFLLIARREVSVSLQQTSATIQEVVTCPQLREILSRTFQRFLDEDRAQAITYARIRYIRTLLASVINSNSDKDFAGMDAMLLSINFNARLYFQYWSDRISDRLNALPSTFEKLTLLANEAKLIRQHAYVRTAAYNPNALPLPEMMSRWIREESELLEKLFTVSQVGGEPSGTNSNATNIEKIELGISVATLAAAVRAMVGSKTIPDENITALGRMLSRCFTTIRSGGAFSPGTFRQSYYTVTDTAKTNVIEIFQRAITWLKKN